MTEAEGKLCVFQTSKTLNYTTHGEPTEKRILWNIFEAKGRVLGKRWSFFPHPLNETSMVKASPSHIRMEVFQRIWQLGTFSILVKSISENPLSINLVYTIFNQTEILTIIICSCVTQGGNKWGGQLWNIHTSPQVYTSLLTLKA